MSRRLTQMTQNFITQPRRLLRSVLIAAALAVAALPTGAAEAAGYVYQQHVVNAGVLVNGSNLSPYLFYVLNQRSDIRPPDLTLVNPLASATASQASAAYWEVSLNSVSDNEMAEFDVLYLRADGITFAPAVNEKLRRFVDNGGQLIVEYGAAAAPAVGLFTGTGAVAGSGSLFQPPVATPLYLSHPLITQPYLLATQDFTGLGNTASMFAISANSADTVHIGEFNTLFSPVLNDTTGFVVAAAQIGAGQVVTSGLNLGQRISVEGSATFTNPADIYAASTPDLKLLANIIQWSESHPSQNKTSHGNASNTGLASFSPAWQAPVTGTAAPSGAAVWGNFVFVTDAAGTLHALDAYPSENLTGGTSTDDGNADFSTGSSYDEIWNKSVGVGGSVPTVAAFIGINYVFVEKNDGSVVSYNAVTGGAGVTLATPTGGPFGTFAGSAPGPTYYDGRLYAGQPNGTLNVYDLSEGTAVNVPLNPNPTTGPGNVETVTGPPSVGTLADTDTNALVAVVPTNNNIYSVLLGARNEPLKTYTPNNTLNGYSINRLGRYDLGNIVADANSPSLLAYDSSGNVKTGVAPSSSSPQDPLFAITDYTGYYTDWNMDFAASTASSSPVNLNYISAASFGQLGNAVTAAMSAPAFDRHGDYYYTETSGSNSYLIGVHNAALYGRVHLKFRFLLPTATGLIDADNVNYNDLVGLHFVGAPVVDAQDNVYAAATNGSNVSVLCFRGDQAVNAIVPAGSPIDLTASELKQQDENIAGTQNTILRGPDSNIGAAAVYGQYIATNGSVSFYNFYGQRGTAQQIAGNLTEPQSVTATDASGNTAVLQMQTNLVWFTDPAQFPLTGTTTAISGLSLVGSSLFLTDGAALYRLSASPLIPTSKEVTTPPTVTPLGSGGAGLGSVGAAPSIGGSVMIVNGTSGIQALTRQVTVIADSGRILGVDGDGSAVWAVDATTRPDLTTGTVTSGTATRVPFSHPTALSQFALNDYLAADTGSNRCVRFDSGGIVQWELTRFTDPNGLLGPGQPLTLSQPTSVVTRPALNAPAISDPNTDGNNPGGTLVYYLVADSGHDRVLEVMDRVSSAGAVLPNFSHILSWVSHTGDRDGRSYRYGSAAYYPNSTISSGLSIAATVTNTRLGPLLTTASGGPGPISTDAPGGSLVVFNYPAPPVPFSTTPTPASDLVYTTAGFYAASVTTGVTPTTTYTPYTIRNPRFLQLNTPGLGTTATAPTAKVAAFDFLYADDNGAFDLSYAVISGKGAFVASPDRLQFTPTAYDAMTLSAHGVPGATITRTNVPFLPTCIQALSTDSQTTGANTTTTRRYLLTQSYSQGQPGGEIFEVDTSSATGVTTPGGFAGNQTLSHPDLTGPLAQPTFGIRLP